MNHDSALRAAADAVPPDLQGMLTLTELNAIVDAYQSCFEIDGVWYCDAHGVVWHEAFPEGDDKCGTAAGCTLMARLLVADG